VRPALLRREGLLTAGWYGAVFLAFGAQLPYWPAWLAHWGLSEAEIASYMGLALMLRVVSATVVPALADRFAARRLVLAGFAAAAALVALAHLLIGTRAVLLAATLAAAVAAAPLVPVGEALGVRAAAMHGFAYAHARSAGSVGFLAMNVAIGALIGLWGTAIVLWAVAASFALATAFGALHPGGGAPPGGGIDRSRLRETLALMAHPVFLIFAVAASIGGASHAVYYVYGTLAWLDQGIGAGTIGLLWATGVVVEIAVLLGPGRRLVERIGPARTIALGTAAGVVRWVAMAFSPPLWLLWPLQALHACTFAVAHLGAMGFVAAAVPPRLQASAQGLYGGGLGGTAMALATLAAGAIGGAWGTASAYWLAAAMSALALAAAIMLARGWDGGPVAQT